MNRNEIFVYIPMQEAQPGKPVEPNPETLNRMMRAYAESREPDRQLRRQGSAMIDRQRTGTAVGQWLSRATPWVGTVSYWTDDGGTRAYLDLDRADAEADGWRLVTEPAVGMMLARGDETLDLIRLTVTEWRELAAQVEAMLAGQTSGKASTG